MANYGVGQSNMHKLKGSNAHLDTSQNSRRSELSLGNTEYSYNFNKTKNQLANMHHQTNSAQKITSNRNKSSTASMVGNRMLAMDTRQS